MGDRFHEALLLSEGRIMGYSPEDLLTIAWAYIRGFFFVRIFEIDTNLYQSGQLQGVFSWLAIRHAGIEGIVDLEGGLDPSKIRKHLKWYHYWHIWDGAISGIDIEELKKVALAIQARTEMGMKVLVHCQGGVNRASLVNGSVLHLRGYKGRAIVNKIREGRPGALTNHEFREYLERFT